MLEHKPGVDVVNAPDIIARVFKMKLDQLIDLIKNKNYFRICIGGNGTNYKGIFMDVFFNIFDDLNIAAILFIIFSKSYFSYARYRIPEAWPSSHSHAYLAPPK